jgi:hypothetical protein
VDDDVLVDFDVGSEGEIHFAEDPAEIDPAFHEAGVAHATNLDDLSGDSKAHGGSSRFEGR